MKQTHIPYGFISGILVVIVSLIIYLMGASFKSGVQYIAYIPFLIGIIMNAVAFSKANDGFVTFGNVFGSGFKASMIVTIVVVAWAVVSIFAFPEMKDKALNMAHEKMMENGQGAGRQMTDEQMDMAMNITKKYYTPIMIAGSIFGTLLYGAVFSLIGAAAAKKKGVNPFGGDVVN